MPATGSIKRLPAWVYGAIALIPITILAVCYSQLDAVGRIELAIPAVFWSAAFGVILWRRTTRRG
jgi:hypothetical protein